MNNINTQDDATLQIGLTDAKPLFYNGSKASSTNSWSQGEVVDIYYNGTNFISYTYGEAKFSTGQKVGDIEIVDVPGTSQTTLMTQKGVTDLISEYNVSLNNNNSEYTFAEAVAFVPASLQKGGLTIKYIDSTTHKYVIRRLKSSSWNTDESNWESIETEIKNLNDTKANKDGYYSQMTVGSAENLVGQTVDSEAYLIRPTGGDSNEVASGVASVLGMEGNSCVWNQMVNATSAFMYSPSGGTGTLSGTTYTFTGNGQDENHTILMQGSDVIAGHKYLVIGYVKFSGNLPSNSNYRGINFSQKQTYSSTFQAVTELNKFQKTYTFATFPSSGFVSIRVGFGTDNFDCVIKDVMLFDLTLLNSTLAAKANLTIAEVEAWLAQHVGTKPYYAYNPGTILSAQTLGIKTYGQNLLNPTTRQAKLIPYEWKENSNVYTIKNVPSGATATFTPDATGVAETVDISSGTLDITSYGSGILELSAATTDTYVCMKWDEQKDDDVVPYEDYTYDFDVRKVYGKVSGAGEYVQCFPNGMRSTDSTHDTLTASEAVVKIGSVDLGSLEWADISSNNYKTYSRVFSNMASNAKPTCAKYYGDIGDYSAIDDNTMDKSLLGGSDKRFNIKDTSLAGKIGSQIATILSGVYANYKLATPITYTDLIYRDGGIDRPLADVLMNITVNNWSMEEQLMTPYVDGNPTSIPATIKTQYGMDAVEAIDTLQKTCYFADDVKANLQALLTCINTNCAETLGGIFAISDTATNKVFTFSFTQNT